MRINPDIANKKMRYLSLNNCFCPNVHRTALPTILLSKLNITIFVEIEKLYFSRSGFVHFHLPLTEVNRH